MWLSPCYKRAYSSLCNLKIPPTTDHKHRSYQTFNTCCARAVSINNFYVSQPLITLAGGAKHSIRTTSPESETGKWFVIRTFSCHGVEHKYHFHHVHSSHHRREIAASPVEKWFGRTVECIAYGSLRLRALSRKPSRIHT